MSRAPSALNGATAPFVCWAAWLLMTIIGPQGADLALEAPFGRGHLRATTAAIAVTVENRPGEHAADGIMTVTAITRTDS
jgi:hypothetical protein